MGLFTKAKTNDDKKQLNVDGGQIDKMLDQANNYQFDHDKTDAQKILDGHFYYGIQHKIKLYNSMDVKDEHTKLLEVLSPKNKPKLVLLKRRLHFLEVYDCKSRQIGYIVKNMDSLVNYYPRPNMIFKTKTQVTLYNDLQLYHRVAEISKHTKLKVVDVIDDEHGALIAKFDGNRYGLCNCYEVKMNA